MRRAASCIPMELMGAWSRPRVPDPAAMGTASAHRSSLSIWRKVRARRNQQSMSCKLPEHQKSCRPRVDEEISPPEQPLLGFELMGTELRSGWRRFLDFCFPHLLLEADPKLF